MFLSIHMLNPINLLLLLQVMVMNYIIILLFNINEILGKITWQVEQAKDCSHAPSKSISFLCATYNKFDPIYALTLVKELSLFLKKNVTILELHILNFSLNILIIIMIKFSFLFCHTTRETKFYYYKEIYN